MKQRKLINEVYEACFDHDWKKLSELRKQEFEKIFRRRRQGKKIYTPKWTVVRV